ncbi:type I-C CRISPR-associated protein Cas8c/Csd1 [Paenibacillaceae bacterium WGS1546]|uniref:type I-C CRISPR-associated protein Cas8c/Csd1 n=1 Tax=Cohnella sp. WGS1546 TaxID=3366810 RepID=UPI00372D432C
MSWLLNLYKTYESNQAFVGQIGTKGNGQEFTLLPVCHTTQNAHVEVEITEDGQFLAASVIDKNEMNTLIPCTESSASRAGAVVAPYPLHDKLSYVAGDFVAYGGEVKKELPFAAYIRELGKWAESVHAHPKVKSIYDYLSKGQLIQDLVRHKVLCVDSDNRLIDRWDKQYETLYPVKPAIFSAVPGDQTSAFIRFNVYSPNKAPVKVWKDPEMFDSFIRYYSEQLGDNDLCYVTGLSLPASERHANKIRHPADKAKLISANDTSGFTFRGRFSQSREAAAISYEVSQKAHNALKWLINRQAKIVDQRVFLVWGNEELDIPAPDGDSYDLDIEASESGELLAYTREDLAREFSKAMDGLRNRLAAKVSELDKDSNVNILIMDSATTGRMGILYYRNMNLELYLDRLIRWHSTCMWLHRYRKNEQGDYVNFKGAPATKEIAFAAYGSRADDKIVKGLRTRMLPCIVDGLPIPKDIVDSARQRASNPVSMERWEWEKTLSIACALINKKEGLNVPLDTENASRDYLFGRLLAIADVLERSALGPDESRATNAIRYMNAFSRHPERTWKTIQACLQPYQAKLGTKATYLSKMIDDVGTRIAIEDFNNRPLSGLYLLGFYSQRHELYQKKEKPQDDPADTSQ